MALSFQSSGVGTNFDLATPRLACAIAPRIIRAPSWSENPDQTPAALTAPIAKNFRRDKNFLFFNCLNSKLFAPQPRDSGLKLDEDITSERFAHNGRRL